MYYRFLRLPDALRQQNRMHKSPARRLSNVTVSLFASLLGFSLPVSAQWISWTLPSPSSQTSPTKSEPPRPKNTTTTQQPIPPRVPQAQNDSLQPQAQAQGQGQGQGQGQEKIQPQKPGDDKNDAKTKLVQDLLLATMPSLERSSYIISLFAFLLLFALIFLSWLTCQALEFTKSAHSSLRKEISAFKNELANLLENTNKQTLKRINLHAADLVKHHATHENITANLSQNLEYLINHLLEDTSKNTGSERAGQGDPLRQREWREPKAMPEAIVRGDLNFHASYQAQSKALSQEIRYVDELQALQKQADEFLTKIKIADPASSLNFAPVQVAASQPTDKQQTLEDLIASLLEEYQRAFFHNDRSALRNMSSDQLNITQSSEDSLVKTSVLPTLLEVVQIGGSYLLIRRDDRHWLVPEFQILTSFTTTQPNKGIFAYQRENISTAELRWPAEVREMGGLWEVVNVGLIAVPS